MNKLASPLSGNARSRILQAALRLFAERGTSEIAVSELAEAAGVARGTIYNNIDQPNALFADVASELSSEMIARVEQTLRGIDDPAVRLATGIRLFVRRAHEEPHWGKFIVNFAMSRDSLQRFASEPPVRDIERAIERRRFTAKADQVSALASLMTGATLASMNAVMTGHQTWRSAGEGAAEFFLRAGGIEPAEARQIAQTELLALSPEPQPIKGRAR